MSLLTWLGRDYMARARPLAAAACYKKALLLQPDCLTALQGLSQACADQALWSEVRAPALLLIGIGMCMCREGLPWA